MSDEKPLRTSSVVFCVCCEMGEAVSIQLDWPSFGPRSPQGRPPVPPPVRNVHYFKELGRNFCKPLRRERREFSNHHQTSCVWFLSFEGIRGHHVRTGEQHDHYYQGFSQILGPQGKTEESRAQSTDQQRDE